MNPKNSVDASPIAQVLYKSLETQLGSSDRVVQFITLNSPFSGALFWVQHQHQSLFIYLAHSTDRAINLDTLNQENNGSVTDKDDLSHLLNNKEVSQLLTLQRQLVPEALHSHSAKLAPFIVIDPYSSSAKKHIFLKSKGLYFFGKELIKSNKFGFLIYKLLGLASSNFVYHHMRRVFNPEIIINNSQDKENISNIKDNLLDEEQEVAAKTDIVLQESDYRSHNYNLTGVNGCVASGKTEALIHRLKLIKQFKPNSNVVVITANSASQVALRERYEKTDYDKSVDIFSFNEWAKRELKPSGHLVDHIELTKIITAQLSKHLDANGISRSVFLRELDFIYGRNIYYEKDYLSSQNITRPYSLSEEQFNHLWRAVLTLKNELSSKNGLLPVRIPQLLLDKVMDMLVTTSFDHILVDDAHLLPPIAFELFKKMLKPKTGQLFITQNPNQGVMNPCQLWRDSNLDLRDQSTRLCNIYKVNLAVINASRAFYLNRLPNEDNQEILQNLKESPDSLLPQLLHFHSEKDEENRLLNEVKKQVYAGCNPKEILIVTNHKKTAHIARLLSETLGVSVDILNGSFYNSHRKRSGLGVCDFMQAQGQSASLVFIFGLKQLFERENEVEFGTNQYQTKLVENTRLISMAMTRAKKELTLFITAEEIPKAFITPYIKIPTDANMPTSGKISIVRYLQTSG